MRKLLQSVTACYYILHSALGIAKCDRPDYKVRQVLQSVIVVTNVMAVT